MNHLPSDGDSGSESEENQDNENEDQPPLPDYGALPPILRSLEKLKLFASLDGDGDLFKMAEASAVKVKRKINEKCLKQLEITDYFPKM